MGDQDPWNLNIHHDEVLARLAPPGSRVLDVGCGDGFLAARLTENGCRPVALDADAAVLGRARRRWAGRDIEWVHADLLTYARSREEFDVVLANAMVHHLPDTREALEAMAGLLRPGGTLGIVGFARNGLADWPRSLVGAVGITAMNVRHRKWEHTAPMAWPPPLTYGQMKRASAETLSGSHFRRLWLGRYLVEWTRPALP